MRETTVTIKTLKGPDSIFSFLESAKLGFHYTQNSKLFSFILHWILSPFIN